MSDEHSKDKRQMAAWVERQLAEKVDQVASKRGITRTAAIVEALQRYVEEETSTAQQLQSLDEKLSSLLSNAPPVLNRRKRAPRQAQPYRPTSKASRQSPTNSTPSSSKTKTSKRILPRSKPAR